MVDFLYPLHRSHSDSGGLFLVLEHGMLERFKVRNNAITENNTVKAVVYVLMDTVGQMQLFSRLMDE